MLETQFWYNANITLLQMGKRKEKWDYKKVNMEGCFQRATSVSNWALAFLIFEEMLKNCYERIQ